MWFAEQRKMKSYELAKHIGITEQNLSILKTGKAKSHSTLQPLLLSVRF